MTENRDNFREHLYDKHNDCWKFDYSDKALDREEPKGPFIMSKLAASTMCETGYPWALHGKKQMDYSKVKHKDETISVLANIGDEKDEKRSHDFDELSGKDGIGVGQEKVASGKQPLSGPSQGDLVNDKKKADGPIFYPKIISSSFVRKTKRKEIDDMEKWWPDRYYYEWRGIPLFVVDDKS